MAEKYLEDFGFEVMMCMFTFEKRVAALEKDGITLVSFSVRLPAHENGEYLLVARFKTDTERLVAFRSGLRLTETFKGFVNGMQYKTLKYKVDDYGEGLD